MNDQPQIMVQSQFLQNHQNYVVWPHRPPPYPPENPVMFSRLPSFTAAPPPPPTANHPSRVSWKASKLDKRNEFRRKTGANSNDPQPPPSVNRPGSKGRWFHHPKKKFSGGGGGGGARLAPPFAPRNTTSFIIRAKKSGGIASLVSPCPVTPAILPTPTLSPAREVLVEMAKEEWGVDGYGSMKGLIRLRAGKGENSDEDSGEDDEETIGNCGCGGGSVDAEERVEVEKRLDHDLSRFEMIYPNSANCYVGGVGVGDALENRVDEQDSHIAMLEEENLTLKERIFLMERELGDLRRRVLCLENDGIGCWRAGGDTAGPENVEDDIAGDVCSEKSVGNGGNDDENGGD